MLKIENKSECELKFEIYMICIIGIPLNLFHQN